jgi:excisionase family DNA binding protein
VSSDYQLLTRAEAAQELRVNPSTLSELTRRNLIYHLRIGRRVLYPRGALHAFIRGETLQGDGSWPPTPPLPDMPDSPPSRR